MNAQSVKQSHGLSEQAMKVTNVRQMNGKLRRDLKMIAGLSFFCGLLTAGSPLSAIGGGALITLGIYDLMAIERNVIRSKSINHIFKRIAQRISKRCNINLKFVCNYNTRQAGFVLCDSSGKIPITSFLTSENISDYLNPEQRQIFYEVLNTKLEKMNSHRGKGKEAKNLKEYYHRDMPKINLDNISHVFDSVGGVLSTRELMQVTTGTRMSYIEYDNFMKIHKKEELWVFSSHLSDYLRELTDMSTNDKGQILMEFEHHFKKYGEEGQRELEKLWDQLRQEQELNKTL